MKSFEQVKNYLETEGINSKEIAAVCGFLYAEGDFVWGTPLTYEVTNKTFSDFVNWYETDDEENGNDEMDGGVFNDEVDDENIIKLGNKLIALWASMVDAVKTAREATTNESIDVDKSIEAVQKCVTLLDVITEHIFDLQMALVKTTNKTKRRNETFVANIYVHHHRVGGCFVH